MVKICGKNARKMQNPNSRLYAKKYDKNAKHIIDRPGRNTRYKNTFIFKEMFRK